MTLTKIAMVFGAVFLLIGVLGFVPAAAPDGMLLGIFHINTAHNLVHLVSAAAALACAKSAVNARLYFKVFGVVYALVAVLGFFTGHGHIMGIVANNMADNLLHVLIAGVSLYLGFMHQEAVA
jgi:hypothetical protein